VRVRRAVAVLGALARPGLPVGPLTTYRVGGAAAVGVVATGLDDLRRVAEAAGELPVLVVGKGSNLLVADAGWAGIALILDADAFGTLTVEGSPALRMPRSTPAGRWPCRRWPVGRRPPASRASSGPSACPVRWAEGCG
jgi:hypothetical protein